LGVGAYDMGAGIIKAIGSPAETLAGVKAILNDPAFRASVGDALADEYAERVDRMATAYEDAGWDGSVTAGVEVGRLIFDVASAVEAAGGVAKLGVSVTTKAGKVIGKVGEAIKSGALVDSAGIERLTQTITGNVGTINRFESAEAVNATMSQYNWAPAWQAGTQVADSTLKPGTMVNMVVNQEAYLALTTPGADVSRAFGGWATFDEVPNLAYVRNDLAITPGMKSGDLYVVQVEVTQPVNAQVGIVGKQAGAGGGGNQLHFNLPPNQRTSTFKFIGGSPLQ
jgi:hypothetical protein